MKFWYILRNIFFALLLIFLGPVATFGVEFALYVVAVLFIISGISCFFKDDHYFITSDGYLQYTTFSSRLIAAAILIIPGVLLFKFADKMVENQTFLYIVSGAVYILVGIFRLVVAFKEKYLNVSKFGKVISFVYPLLIIFAGVLFFFSNYEQIIIFLIIHAIVFWIIRTIMVSKFIY